MIRKGIAPSGLLLVILLVSCFPSAHVDPDDSITRWEQDIRVFDSLNRVEYSDENTLLVTGSSSVRLWDSIHSDLAPYPVMQRGYGGAKLTDFTHYAPRIIKPHPFRAILVFVANDITGGADDRSPREVLSLYRDLVQQIRRRNGETPVFWIETTPTPSRWAANGEIRKANRLIREYSERNDGLYFISTFDHFLGPAATPDSALFQRDMLHLNRDGYLLWTRIIKENLTGADIHPVAETTEQYD